MCRRLADAVEDGKGFGGHFVNYLQRAHDRSPEFLDRLLVWFPPDSLHVEHSITADGLEFQADRTGLCRSAIRSNAGIPACARRRTAGVGSA